MIGHIALDDTPLGTTDMGHDWAIFRLAEAEKSRLANVMNRRISTTHADPSFHVGAQIKAISINL
jgi:hypothetical protein